MNEAQHLSARMTQCIRLIASGKSRKEIAASLGLSVKTVEYYLQCASRRIGLHGNDVAGMTRFAISTGLIALDKDTEKARQMKKNELKAMAIALVAAIDAAMLVWLFPFLYYYLTYRVVCPGGWIGIRI